MYAFWVYMSRAHLTNPFDKKSSIAGNENILQVTHHDEDCDDDYGHLNTHSQV